MSCPSWRFHHGRQAMTTQLLDDPKRRDQVLGLLQAADLGITGAVKREIDPAMRERVRRVVRILDASLHPALVTRLIRLFQDPQTNREHAQLVFNSHDATLLGDSVDDATIGRDQVWFTEKRDGRSTRLYALADLAPRKAEAIGRRYLAGRYGAIPILSGQQFADAITAAPGGGH